MNNNLMSNKTAKIRKKPTNLTINMKINFTMNTYKKIDHNNDQKQVVIQEEEKSNKLKKTNKYYNINK